MRILVVNSGSSSLKLRVIEDDDSVSQSDDLPVASGGADQDFSSILASYGPVDAVGHRIVHGGTFFSGPVLIDETVIQRLSGLADLAPLHQPRSLAALAGVNRALPAAPAIACFDTAFHATLPAAATTYAVPREWTERWGLRRYGFHGLSHSYAAARGAELMGRELEGLRLVTCHLGAGSSLAAVLEGRSVDTTMGFTPLEGLVMATRSGTVDPGMMLWLQRIAGMPADELAEGLENRSGLQGLAGSNDMREILAREDRQEPAALLALDVYSHRLRAGIAAMTAALGGIDGLIFTGGIGENSPAVRQRAIDGLGFLGLGIDRDRNQNGGGDREIGAGEGPRVVVVSAREDLQIAREVRTCLAG